MKCCECKLNTCYFSKSALPKLYKFMKKIGSKNEYILSHLSKKGDFSASSKQYWLGVKSNDLFDFDILKYVYIQVRPNTIF